LYKLEKTKNFPKNPYGEKSWVKKKKHKKDQESFLIFRPLKHLDTRKKVLNIFILSSLTVSGFL
jgi:hypothetical protein